MAAERPTARMHRERAQGAAASARLGPLLHGDGGLRTADGHRAGRHEGRRGREAGGEEQRAHHRAAEVILRATEGMKRKKKKNEISEHGRATL